MLWVETTGRTVEEAKELALDQLGVDEVDAEFEVLEEPKLGLFGRVRSEARVRARVKPQAPPPKLERRERRRGRGRKDDGTGAAAPDDKPAARDREARNGGNRRPATKQGGSRGARRVEQGENVDEREPRERAVLTQEQIDDQVAAVRDFLDGLLDAFGADAEVKVGMSEDGAIEAAIEGEDVGLLLGPRGATLDALQELARRALQQHSDDSLRLRVDVGGYRERRREALAKFATKVAAQVVESGEAASLEPMTAADRKVVHDTVNDIDGVRTSSEGEEPRRRVVISPVLIGSLLEQARDLGFLGPGPVAFHVEHARAYLAPLEGVTGAALDLGAGGGVPGLVLAAARPDLAWTFLDGMPTRTAFLAQAVTQLGLANVTVRTARAEEVPDLRGRFAAVVARSFAAPPVTAECAAPLLQVGGRLIVSEPPEEAGDRWAGAGLVGLGPARLLPGPPRLVVLVQESPCPDRYPRRTGVPAKRPLW